MNLDSYDLQTLLLTALRSEIEARHIYNKMANRVKNFMLKDRMNFLADEEKKHANFFRVMYEQKFPGSDIELPEKSPVPLPGIRIDDESLPISDLIGDAMEAEKAAHDFYMHLSERYSDNADVKNMLIYIATMEMGHYKLLEIEQENCRVFESFDITWPLMHVGP